MDIWGFVRPAAGKRTRGRLVTHEGRLLLLTVGPTVTDLGAVESVDARRHTVRTDQGEVRWQTSCTCGWPRSLKGPVAELLKQAGA